MTGSPSPAAPFTLKIANLSYRTTEASLEEQCRPLGCCSVCLGLNRDGLSKGRATVGFATEKATRVAYLALNQLNFEGRRLAVERPEFAAVVEERPSPSPSPSQAVAAPAERPPPPSRGYSQSFDWRRYPQTPSLGRQVRKTVTFDGYGQRRDTAAPQFRDYDQDAIQQAQYQRAIYEAYRNWY
jgi:RNA recognition motif-containing protein